MLRATLSTDEIEAAEAAGKAGQLPPHQGFPPNANIHQGIPKPYHPQSEVAKFQKPFHGAQSMLHPGMMQGGQLQPAGIRHGDPTQNGIPMNVPVQTLDPLQHRAYIQANSFPPGALSKHSSLPALDPTMMHPGMQGDRKAIPAQYPYPAITGTQPNYAMNASVVRRVDGQSDTSLQKRKFVDSQRARNVKYKPDNGFMPHLAGVKSRKIDMHERKVKMGDGKDHVSMMGPDGRQRKLSQDPNAKVSGKHIGGGPPQMPGYPISGTGAMGRTDSATSLSRVGSGTSLFMLPQMGGFPRVPSYPVLPTIDFGP